MQADIAYTQALAAEIALRLLIARIRSQWSSFHRYTDTTH